MERDCFSGYKRNGQKVKKGIVKNMKIGLLLEGGAMRGLYTAGILDVFMEEGIHADTVMGVSAGALFGMNYKSRQVGRVLRYNLQYAGDRHYMGLYSLLTTGNIMNRDFCFNKIVNQLDPVDFAAFRENPMAFYAVVTNMETGQAEYIPIDDLQKEEQLEYLRASGSMPFVSRPVPVGGKKYLDGGIADSIPISKMLDMGFDKIITVLTRPVEYRKKERGRRLPEIYYRSYPHLAHAIYARYRDYNASMELVAALEKDGKIFVLRPSRMVPIRRIEKDKARIQEMYDLGRGDALAKLASLRDFLSD